MTQGRGEGMAIFLDSVAMEFGRTMILIGFLSLTAWTARSLVRIWLPVIKAQGRHL